MMVVFEMHNAKIHCLGSGVAPKTPIPRYPIGQQSWFWLPRMGVIELHIAKKYCWDGAPNTHTTVPCWPAKDSFDTYDEGV